MIPARRSTEGCREAVMGGSDPEDAIEVEISDTQGHLRVEPGELAGLVRTVLTAEGRPRASISIALVDEATIHAINRSHLGHNWPTDVISFPLSEPSEATLAGELVVSAEMAAATAAEIGAEPRDELALYVVHGLLHLCGYDDLTEPEAAAMRRREGELLAASGRPNPFDLARGRRGPRAEIEGSAIAPAAGPVPAAHPSEPSSWVR
jgi:probable rRNA maturation factor